MQANADGKQIIELYWLLHTQWSSTYNDEKSIGHKYIVWVTWQSKKKFTPCILTPDELLNNISCDDRSTDFPKTKWSKKETEKTFSHQKLS